MNDMEKYMNVKVSRMRTHSELCIQHRELRGISEVTLVSTKEQLPMSEWLEKIFNDSKGSFYHKYFSPCSCDFFYSKKLARVTALWVVDVIQLGKNATDGVVSEAKGLNPEIHIFNGKPIKGLDLPKEVSLWLHLTEYERNFEKFSNACGCFWKRSHKKCPCNERQVLVKKGICANQQLFR